MTTTNSTTRVRSPEMLRNEIIQYRRDTGMSFADMAVLSPFAPIPGGTLSAICKGYPVPRCWYQTFNIRSVYTISYQHIKIRSDNPASAATTIANALQHGKISQYFIDRFYDELDIRLPDPCDFIPFGRNTLMNTPYDDYELDYDIDCPRCEHAPTKVRDCDAIGCEDGFIDGHDEDPINLAPGEVMEICHDCWGSGLQRWCPKCGFDLQLHAYKLSVKEETSND